ncbi:hypothetical protein BGX30_004359 [Mortierella sp. GBA39]|nr:hypothetical protein BGX30_004359 [Mortierella sp. GBA39]
MSDHASTCPPRQGATRVPSKLLLLVLQPKDSFGNTPSSSSTAAVGTTFPVNEATVFCASLMTLSLLDSPGVTLLNSLIDCTRIDKKSSRSTCEAHSDDTGSFKGTTVASTYLA